MYVHKIDPPTKSWIVTIQMTWCANTHYTFPMSSGWIMLHRESRLAKCYRQKRLYPSFARVSTVTCYGECDSHVSMQRIVTSVRWSDRSMALSRLSSFRALCSYLESFLLYAQLHSSKTKWFSTSFVMISRRPYVRDVSIAIYTYVCTERGSMYNDNT